MFLMFQLGRLDVWPTLDFGVRAGYMLLYGVEESLTPKQLVGEGERFRPYRSLVAWYCWRAADTVTPS
jgi:DNA-3-methyladenine glycosylase II